jgi:hypothetical protein
MDKEDEIQTLRRELELLRAQVDGQRGGSGGGGGGGGDPKDGTARQDSPVKPLDGSFRVGKPTQPSSPRTPSPRRCSNGATTTVDSARRVSLYEERDQRQSRSLESEYVNHVPVDTKRGKWWLKDRQVLSRNVPTPDAEIMAVKVRETWLWSGRTVVVDKVVSVPTSRMFNELDANRQADCDTKERRPSEFDTIGAAELPQQSSNAAPDVYAESKQLAKEFMLSSPSRTVSDDGRSGLTASARMEAEMARAVATTNSSNESSSFLARDAAPQTPNERFE